MPNLFISLYSLLHIYKYYSNISRRMRLRQHVIVSLTFSAFLFVITKSWVIFTASFISGVLIDLDHVLDYLWEPGMCFRVKEFFDIHYNDKLTFHLVIFHSWELLFPLNIYVFLLSGNLWIMGITIGFTQHVILDQIFNKPPKWNYFFFWRLKHNFCHIKMNSN